MAGDAQEQSTSRRLRHAQWHGHRRRLNEHDEIALPASSQSGPEDSSLLLLSISLFSLPLLLSLLLIIFLQLSHEVICYSPSSPPTVYTLVTAILFSVTWALDDKVAFIALAIASANFPSEVQVLGHMKDIPLR